MSRFSRLTISLIRSLPFAASSSTIAFNFHIDDSAGPPDRRRAPPAALRSARSVERGAGESPPIGALHRSGCAPTPRESRAVVPHRPWHRPGWLRSSVSDAIARLASCARSGWIAFATSRNSLRTASVVKRGADRLIAVREPAAGPGSSKRRSGSPVRPRQSRARADRALRAEGRPLPIFDPESVELGSPSGPPLPRRSPSGPRAPSPAREDPRARFQGCGPNGTSVLTANMISDAGLGAIYFFGREMLLIPTLMVLHFLLCLGARPVHRLC